MMAFTRKFLAIGAVALATLAGTGVRAEEPATSTSEPSVNGWRFGVEVYGWLPQINITSAAGDEMELPLWQILQNLNFTGMVTLAANHGKWSVVSDLIYMNLQGTNTSTANIVNRPVQTGVGIKLESLISTNMLGYTFYQNESTTLTALAGFRYLWLKPDLSFNIGAAGGNVVSQGHVFDGLVGFRGKTDISENWHLTYYGDVGAGQSDITWQAAAGINRRFGKVDAVLGYRYLDWNFDNKANLDDLTIHGPYAGIKVKF